MNYEDRDLIGRMGRWSKRVRTGLQGGRMLRDLMRTHVDQTLRRFKTKKGPDGEKWAKWSDSYAATRSRGHSLLMDTRDTLKSLGRSAIKRAGSGFTYEPSTPYAAMANKAREFMGVGTDDFDELETRLGEIMRAEAERHGLA